MVQRGKKMLSSLPYLLVSSLVLCDVTS
uniref:Uncharacterized protein n=1 Tax=Anguilla anguilla TaxID=7936 RepID=A0A0E9T2J1_ANGAN